MCEQVVCEQVVCEQVVFGQVVMRRQAAGGGGRREEAGGSAQPKTRTPHKDLGKKVAGTSQHSQLISSGRFMSRCFKYL